jgi:hypothetical protein
VFTASLTLHESERRNRLRASSVAISEIYVKMADGDTQVVETFDFVEHWSLLESAPESASDVWQPAGEVLNGDSAANFLWTAGGPLVSRGIFPGPPMVPLTCLRQSRSRVKTVNAWARPSR